MKLKAMRAGAPMQHDENTLGKTENIEKKKDCDTDEEPGDEAKEDDGHEASKKEEDCDTDKAKKEEPRDEAKKDEQLHKNEATKEAPVHEAKKEEAVGKKGKTLKQLFSHSSSSSRV